MQLLLIAQSILRFTLKVVCILQGLENYIQTLPSEDEFTALKSRCRAKEDECGRLNMKITSLALKLEKSEKQVKGLLDSRDSSEIEVSKTG